MASIVPGEETGLDIRNNFFSEVDGLWNRLSRKVVQSQSLEVLKERGDVILRNMV